MSLSAFVERSLALIQQIRKGKKSQKEIADEFPLRVDDELGTCNDPSEFEAAFARVYAEYSKTGDQLLLQTLGAVCLLGAAPIDFRHAVRGVRGVAQQIVVVKSIASLIGTISQTRWREKNGRVELAREIVEFLAQSRERLEELSGALVSRLDANVASWVEQGRREKPAKLNLMALVADISPLPNQTGTKLILDYIVGLACNEQVASVALLLTYEETLGQTGAISLSSFRCREFDILARIRAEYPWIKPEWLQKITIDATLRGAKLDRYVEAFVQSLNAIKPDCVISFEYKSTILTEFVARKCPSVYVPMQIGLSPRFLPSIECVMQHDPRLQRLRGPHWFAIERQVSYPLAEISEITPVQVRTSPTQIVVLCAAVDIDLRVPEDRLQLFFESMFSVLRQSPSAIFVVLGVPPVRLRRRMANLGIQLDPAWADRFISVEYEKNFVGLVRQCDIFVMPAHRGGGRSIRTALNEGLVALALTENDGNLYMPPGFIFEDETSMAACLVRLLADRAALHAAKHTSVEHFRALDVQPVVERFLMGCRAAMAEWSKRQILVLGDSHATVFRWHDFAQHLENTAWTVEAVHGATLSGLENPNSRTQAGQKFQRLLQRAQWSAVVFLLGEVDLGFVIWYRAERDGTAPEQAARKAVENYQQLILAAKEVCEQVIVISAPLPTIADGQRLGAVASARKSISATQRQRTNLTLWFNQEMARWSSTQSGVTFIDLDRDSLGPEQIVCSELKHRNPNDHHYDPRRYAELLQSRLIPILGKVIS